MNKTTLGTIFVGLAVLTGTTDKIFGKLILEELEPVVLACIAQGILLVTLCFCYGLIPILQQIRKCTKKEILLLCCIACLSGIIAPLLFLEGLSLSSATDTALLSRMEAVLTGIISMLWLKERLTAEQAFGIVFMVAGMVIIITHNLKIGLTANIGSIYILLAALVWAFSTNVFKLSLSHIKPELVIFMRNMIAFTVLVLYTGISGKLMNGIETVVEAGDIKTLIAFSVVSLLMAQIFWYQGVERIHATLASSLTLFSPLAAITLAIIFLDEPLYLYHIAGGLLMIGGLTLTIFHQQKHPQHATHQRLRHGMR